MKNSTVCFKLVCFFLVRSFVLLRVFLFHTIELKCLSWKFSVYNIGQCGWWRPRTTNFSFGFFCIGIKSNQEFFFLITQVGSNCSALCIFHFCQSSSCLRLFSSTTFLFLFEQYQHNVWQYHFPFSLQSAKYYPGTSVQDQILEYKRRREKNTHRKSTVDRYKNFFSSSVVSAVVRSLNIHKKYSEMTCTLEKWNRSACLVGKEEKKFWTKSKSGRINITIQFCYDFGLYFWLTKE